MQRASLLGRLAGFIERASARQPGRRVRALLALDDEELVEAVGGAHAEELLDAHRGADPAELPRRMAAARCEAVCRHERGYPGSLHDLGDQAPAALFVRGADAALGELRPDGAVTVVGARRATSYGLGIAAELSRMLARAGLAVVSGLANGIDSRAHSGALEGAGLTIAVLGGGVDIPYPRRQAGLYRRIVAGGGVLLSELPPGTSSFRWCFPARNRIMAALAGLTVVVEAAERSGSLITAAMALDLGRAVGAVPGPVNSWVSSGANQLLVEGAAPIRDAQDVLDRILGPGRVSARARGPELEPELAAVLGRVEAGAATCDAVALGAGIGAPAAAGALTRLELLGYLASDAGGRYSRTALAAPEGS